MQHDDLDREQAICDAATAGPWTVCPWDMYIFGPNGEMVADAAEVYVETLRIRGYGACLPMEHNGAFITAARTAWPARIEECRRLREREAALLAEIERLKAAGEVLAETTRTNWAGEISRKEDEACRVFEERK